MWILQRGRKESWSLRKITPIYIKWILTSLNEPSTSFQSKKAKTPLWKVSQENTQFYSQAHQVKHQSDLTCSSQSQPLQAKTQTTVLTQGEVGSQRQPPQLAQPQPQAQTQPKVAVDQAVDQAPANFPVLLPQRRQLPVVVRHRHIDPFADEDDSFSIDLDNEALQLVRKC